MVRPRPASHQRHAARNIPTVVILTLVESTTPPTHLLQGRDAVEAAGARIAALQGEIAAWKSVSISTNLQ
ncbi:MAG TPA: hypothetical protein VGS02_15405 [Acidobacteriaceae bacterium]|nr:hypothetical protein [Acidobacteriaceae bacterium]